MDTYLEEPISIMGNGTNFFNFMVHKVLKNTSLRESKVFHNQEWGSYRVSSQPWIYMLSIFKMAKKIENQSIDA